VGVHSLESRVLSAYMFDRRAKAKPSTLGRRVSLKLLFVC